MATLTHWDSATIGAVKSFIVQALGGSMGTGRVLSPCVLKIHKNVNDSAKTKEKLKFLEF